MKHEHERIALVADMQLDEDAATTLPGTQPGMTRRLEDRIECWRWALKTAKKEGCTLIAILGDVMDDRAAVTLPVLHAFALMLEEAKAEAIEVVILAGNHDSHLRDTTINSIRPYRGMATVIDTPSLFDGIAMVPWAEGKDYVKAVKKMRGKSKLLFSHKLLTGAMPQVEGIDPSIYEGFSRVFLGDVHEPVVINDRVQYVGAWMQFNFGDAGAKRGIMVYNRKKDQITYHENPVSPRYFVIANELMGVEAGDFRACDHVRFTTPVDPKDYETIRKAVASVEAPPSVEIEFKNRSNINASMSDKKVLKRYLKAVKLYSKSRLKSGLELLSAS